MKVANPRFGLPHGLVHCADCPIEGRCAPMDLIDTCPTTETYQAACDLAEKAELLAE